MIRWGIIGCGDVCEKKSGPAFALTRGSSVSSVMRRDRAKARSYAARHGVPRYTGDAAELLDDPEIDAFYVATPPDTHAYYACEAARRRKPCYVEKPMARSYDECRQMLAAFREKDTKLFVAYYRRCLPRFIQVKELLESGAIGPVHSVQVRHAMLPHPAHEAAVPWRLQAERSGGGLFLDVGSHTLDLLDYVLGPLSDVRGEAWREDERFEVEDQVVLEASVAHNGASVRVSGRWDFCADAPEDLVEIVGDEGSLSFAMQSPRPLLLRTACEQRTLAIEDSAFVQQPMIQAIVDELSGEGSCPSSGESAARTSRVMDEVLANYYGGRAGPFWTRVQRS